MRPAHYRTRPRTGLTPRQREVLSLVARGKTNPEIADALGISLDAAKFHVSEILSRLGVDTREEASAWWRAHNRVDARMARAIGVAFTHWLAVGSVAAAGAAVIALVAAGTGGTTPVSVSPTSAPTHIPTVASTLEPLLTTRHRVVLTETDSDTHVQSVVLFDLDANRVVSKFDLPGPPYTTVTLAPGGLFLSDSTNLRWTAYDGSNRRVLYTDPDGGGVVGPPAVSPDGKTLAFSVSNFSLTNGDSIVFLDFATGEVLRQVQVTSQTWPGFFGFPNEVRWRGDGTGVAVLGATQTEQPGGAATVYMDGTVHVSPVQAFDAVSPDGRLLAYNESPADKEPIGFGCMAVATHTITVIDMVTDTKVATITDPGSALTRQQWSPDGTSFLYSSQAYTPGSDCSWVTGPSQWYLLPIDGGLPTQVVDLNALVEQWYGRQRVTYTCAGQPQAIDGLPLYSQSSGGCLDGSAATISIDGHNVGSASQFEILGFLPVEPD